MDLTTPEREILDILNVETQQSTFDRLSPDAYARMIALAKKNNDFAGDLQLRAHVLKKARRIIARHDSSAFCEYVLRGESNAKPIRQAPMHDEMHRLVRNWLRIVMWGSPASGKSLQFAVGYPLWEIGRDLNIHIAVIQATDKNALKTVRSLASYIADPKAPGYGPLHEVFPEIKRSKRQGAVWNAHGLTVEREATARDPTIQCCGLFGNILGARLDLVVLDDILTFNNTRNVELREKTIEWLVTTVLNRLDPDTGRLIFLGNAWHPDDAMHVLAEGRLDESLVEALPGGFRATESGWASARFPLRDANGKTTWPDKWPQRTLDKVIRGLPPAEVARTIDCIAQSDATSRLRQEWFTQSKKPGLAGLIEPGKAALMRDQRPDDDPRAYYVGVDLAFADIDKRGDRCALGVIAVDSNNRVELVSIRSGRWMIDELIGEIVGAYHKFDPNFIFVESNAAQSVIGRILRGGLVGLGLDFPPNLKSRIRDFTTSVSKHHPKWGIEGIGVEMKQGLWSIPVGLQGEAHPEIERWINEMLHYTPDPKIHTGDRAMAIYMAWDGCRRRLGNRTPTPLDDEEHAAIVGDGSLKPRHTPAPPKKRKQRSIEEALANVAMVQPRDDDIWGALDDFTTF
jgi:hypothetical protein